ncbi:MAG: hypothetical protein RM021_033630 [Nostoc sp. EkiNYC01]|nr:hypothetical protein [Nostoc sp. EkiNYC01]
MQVGEVHTRVGAHSCAPLPVCVPHLPEIRTTAIALWADVTQA